MRFTLPLLLGLFTVGCTIESTTTSTNPGSPPSSETPPGEDPQKTPSTPETPQEPWLSTSAPAEVRQITCPTDDSVHIATSKGLYTYADKSWKEVASGAFNSVHLHDAKLGYAAG